MEHSTDKLHEVEELDMMGDTTIKPSEVLAAFRTNLNSKTTYKVNRKRAPKWSRTSQLDQQ